MRTRAALLTVAVTAIIVALLVPSGALAAEPVPTSAPVAPVVLAAASTPLPTVADEYGPGRSSPVELLPAWRWRQVAPKADYGKFDIGEIASSGISTGLTSLANVLWNMVLWITAAVFSFDLVGQAAKPMDQAFLALARPVVNSGVWVLLLFGSLLVALRRAFTKGDIAGALRTLLLTLVPLALLLVLVGNSERGLNTAAGYADDGPAGLAVRAVRGMDDFGATFSSAVVTGFGLINTGASMAGNTDTGPLGCAAYSGAMTDQYRAVTDSAVGSAGDQLVVLSNLWERGFLDPWGRIQFGEAVTADGQPYRDYVGCRQLEQNRNTRPDQQYELTVLATRLQGTPVAEPPSLGLFLVGSRQNERTATVMFWAGCRYDGAWRADPGFAVVGQLDAAWCADAWRSGAPDGSEVQPSRWRRAASWVLTPIDVLTPLNLSDRLNLTSAAIVESRQGPAGSESYEAGKLVLDYWGANSGDRLVYSFITLLTAVVYLYALGVISIGALLAKFGLIVLIALLPLTLLLMAVPSSRDRGGAGQLGAKMLRVTGAMVATNFVFTVFLVTLIQLITLISALLAGLGDGLRFLGPMVAFFLFKMLTRMLGLGDLTNLSGALGMTAGAAMRAAGAGGVATDMQNRTDRSLLGTKIAKGKKDLTSRTGTLAARPVKGAATGAWKGAKTGAQMVAGGTKSIMRHREQGEIRKVWGRGKQAKSSALEAVKRAGDAINRRRGAGDEAVMSADKARGHFDDAMRSGAVGGSAGLYTATEEFQDRIERAQDLNRLTGGGRAAVLIEQMNSDLVANSAAYAASLGVDPTKVAVGSSGYLGVSKTAFAAATGVPADMVYASAWGAAPVVAPRSKFPSSAMSADQTMAVLSDPAYHIDPKVHEFLKAQNLDEDGMNAALHMVVSAAGYDGVDYLRANGVNAADPKVLDLLLDDTKREQNLAGLSTITLDSKDLRTVVRQAKQVPSATVGTVTTAQLNLAQIVDSTREQLDTSGADIARIQAQVNNLAEQARKALEAGHLGQATRITQSIVDYNTPLLEAVNMAANIEIASTSMAAQTSPAADLSQIAAQAGQRCDEVVIKIAAAQETLLVAESATIAAQDPMTMKLALEQLLENQQHLVTYGSSAVGSSVGALASAQVEIERQNRQRAIDPRMSSERRKLDRPVWAEHAHFDGKVGVG
jgi:hypothetical protein